jgi:hypothetical protein
VGIERFRVSADIRILFFRGRQPSFSGSKSVDWGLEDTLRDKIMEPEDFMGLLKADMRTERADTREAMAQRLTRWHKRMERKEEIRGERKRKRLSHHRDVYKQQHSRPIRFLGVNEGQTAYNYAVVGETNPENRTGSSTSRMKTREKIRG